MASLALSIDSIITAGKVRILHRTGPKENTVCHSCGAFGHWRDEEECSMNKDKQPSVGLRASPRLGSLNSPSIPNHGSGSVVERINSRESLRGLVEKYTSIEAEGSLAYSPQPTEGLAMQVVSPPPLALPEPRDARVAAQG